jgi:hypothetical protein
MAGFETAIGFLPKGPEVAGFVAARDVPPAHRCGSFPEAIKTTACDVPEALEGRDRIARGGNPGTWNASPDSSFSSSPDDPDICLEGRGEFAPSAKTIDVALSGLRRWEHRHFSAAGSRTALNMGLCSMSFWRWALILANAAA